jgi:hypothetical protein
LPALRAALVQHEKAIVGQKNEHARVLDALGNVIVSRAGTKHRVSFTPDELAQMRGATFTHNHHYTTGLTMEDGRFAADNHLAEMRAVDANHTYSLRPSLHTNWSQQYWDRVIQPSWNRNRDAVANEIRLQAWRTGKAPDDLASQQWHQVWERVARETGLRYARTGPASKARYVDRTQSAGYPSEAGKIKRAARA